MAMKLLCIFVILVSLMGVSISFNLTNAQKESSMNMVKDFKLDATKPSVFLTFERVGEIASKKSSITKKVVVLKMHNNTIFPIAVDGNFDTRLLKTESLTLSDGTVVETIPNNSLIEVCFDVDVIPYTTSLETKGKNSDKKEIIVGIQQKHENPAENDKTTCFWRNSGKSDDFGNGDRLWIKPKQSFSFSVPAEYLKENLKISTLFNYEWEFVEGKLNFDDPKHKVYFYGSDLLK